MIDVEVSVPRESGFFAWVKRQLIRDVGAKVNRAAGSIRSWLPAAISAELRRSETYHALRTGGVLSYELGLGDYQQNKVEDCVEYVSRSAVVTEIPAQNDTLGGVRIVLLSGGLPDLLGQQFAAYISAGKRGTTTVPWLDWLLTGGSEILLADHRIMYVRPGRAASSRTGIALMRPGSGWSLPGSRGGVTGDNWVENALTVVAEAAGEKLAREIGGIVR